MVTPRVSHSARSVRKWERRRGARDVQLRTMFTVTRLSLTRVSSRERANVAKARSPWIAARSSSSLMLEPSLAASKKPDAGTCPFQTALYLCMLASVNIAALGAGHISRPTCTLLLKLAHHRRSRIAA